jgi:hypothetical protein
LREPALAILLKGGGCSGLLAAVVDDEYRDRRVVEHEVRNGAKNRRADGTAPAGAHHDQIVVCGYRALQELCTGVSGGRAPRYGDALGNERLSFSECLLRGAVQASEIGGT